MSTTIDQKVVEMRFDNKNFEQNIAATMTTLDKFKQKLSLDGASKGLESVNETARRVDMSGLGSAVETVRAKFSALQVMGVTALSNITNSAINAGKRMISALTIDPIKTGFSEYETKINAVQTIMSNTASKGKTMADVTKVLNELNTYADKTIYNFAEMTKNIGTFTAAGVGLEDSASAIQGIANLAAASGSTSQQASTAMYQLSQALSSGTVKLQDWNSVVNAGMGGQKFQDALKATAKEHGIAVDKMIKDAGSFRESLSKGWVTADVLNETLRKFTVEGAKEYADSMVKSGKYTKEQADALIKEAQAMEDAATKVKTFTQLWDTLQESAQSGWSQTWEIIVGDFEEAKETLTKFSEAIGSVIEESANARNVVLQGWKDAGGRADIVDSLFNIFNAAMSVVKPIKEAFNDIFPPITVEQLKKITENLKKFTAGLTLSTETSDKFKRIFKGIFSIFDVARKVIMSVTKALFGLSQSKGIESLADLVLSAAASIGDLFTSINEGFDGNGLTNALSNVSSALSKAFEKTTGWIRKLGSAFSSIGPILSSIGSWFKKAGQWIVEAANEIYAVVKNVFSWIRENVSLGEVFAGLAGGGIFVAAKKLSGVFDTIKDAIDNLFGDDEDGGLSIKDKFAEVLDSVKESIQSFTAGIKVWSIVGIAAAIGILAHSLKTISDLNFRQLVRSLTAIGTMLGILMVGFKVFTKTLKSFESKGIIKSALTLVLIASAIDILADAMVVISELTVGQVVKGLTAIGVAMLELCLSLKLIGSSKSSLSTITTVLALAVSCKILAGALQEFATMSWSEIGRGLTAMGGALAEVVAMITVLNKVGGKGSVVSSVGILVTVSSLGMLAKALKEMATMSWSEIGRGLTAMGGALAEIGIITGVLGKVVGASGLLGSASIVLLILGLKPLANALQDLGSMSWSEIGRSLTAMGGALLEIALITGLLAYLSPGAIIGSASILLMIAGLKPMAEALLMLGSMSWSEVGRGLTAMGGALLEIALITGALAYLSPGAIIGSAGILLMVAGLKPIAEALLIMGSMSWSEIGRGLTAMGGALLEIALITGALAYLSPGAIAGSAAILVAVQGLGKLADALVKLGGMSWEEIKRGLAAMGGALGELAIGGFINTLSIIGASSIAKMAEPLGVLADSLLKWKDVTVPDSLGTRLNSLAAALFSFTLSGAGASAIAKVAEPLGTLSKSVKSWKDVVIPGGIDKQLKSLADGILSFTFAGLGGRAINILAEPLGLLAVSVKKWKNVGIPNSIGEELTLLADGVKAFSWAFMGGWSLNAIVEPLSELAGSVHKWKDVTVPENISENLSSLADGVKSFSWAFLGGWTIGDIVEPLGALVDSVNKWNGVAISPKLGENLTILAEGVSGFTWAFMSGWSLDTLVEPLADLPDSLKKWKDVTVPETLKDDLTRLAEGVKEFSWAFLGGWSLGTVVEPLGELPESLKKWKDVSVPEGIKEQLSNLADGISSFNSKDDEAEAIATISAPLGTLADSVKKWVDISVPKEISDQLSGLADGVASFKFNGNGAEAIATVSEPLGTLADSVKKWIDVTVPEELPEQLSGLADGVFSFTLGGLGANAMSTLAEPLGTLSDSVKKWKDVTVPTTIGDDLTILADGVKALSFTFMGGWSLSTIVEPMSKLIDSIKKWKDVTVPETLETDLTSIANGIKSFSFAFAGGWSLSAIVEPLDRFIDIVKKCTGIKAPEDLKDSLTSIAEAVGEFGLIDVAKLQLVDDNLLSLSDAFVKFASVNVNGDQLVTFAKKVTECGTELKELDSSSISTAVSAIGKLDKVLKDISSIDTSKVSKFVTAANSLNSIDISDIKVDTKTVSSAISSVQKVMDDIEKTISKRKKSLADAMKTAMSDSDTSITSKKKDIVDAVKIILDAVKNKIDDDKKTVTKAFKGLVSGAASAIKEHSDSIESAGSDLGSGLVKGIDSKQQAVYDAGYRLGQQAVQGEKDGQQSKSPSKLTILAGKWIGEGLIIGMDAMFGSVYKTGYYLGETATNSISNTISRISDMVNSDIDAQPTIRPVFDLSDVRSGVNTLGGMLNFGSSVDVLANVGSINTAMNRRIQNGSTNDVVTAIKKLGKDLGNMERNSYNINGINYQEGDDVAEALHTIVRAAVRERRV